MALTLGGGMLNLGIRVTVDGAGQAVADVQRLDKGVAGLGDTGLRVGSMLGSLKNGFVQLAAVVGGAFAAKEFIQQADAMSLIEARLKNATAASGDFKGAQQAVYDIAQQNNIGLQEASQLYTKLLGPVTRLGGSTKEVTGITQAFALSLRVGGASAGEAASATLQFAQAMGSGKLSGDEFNAMTEASPRFMEALASGMGKPIEELKKMGSEGKLTADVVGNALLVSLRALKDEARSIPDTVGGAMTRLRNDILVAVAYLNKSSGLTLGIAGLVEAVRTDLLPVIRDELAGAFSVVGDFITKNREEIGEVWTATKGLVGDVYEVAKAAAAVGVALVGWAVESGAVRTVVEGVRLILAGVIDGVTVLAGGFATLGSLIIQFAVAPLQLLLKTAAAVAGVFDEDLAAKIRGVSAGIEESARAGQVYGAQVVRNFMDGKSAVGELDAEIGKHRVQLDQQRIALDKGSISVADNTRETRKLNQQLDESDSTYKSLTARVKAQTAEDKKAGDEKKKLIESYVKQTAAASKKSDETERELAIGRKLGDAEKVYINLMRDVGAGKLRLTDLTVAKTAATLREEMALEDVARELADYNKELEAGAKAYSTVLEAERKRTQSLSEQVEKEREAAATVGMSARELAARTAAQLRDNAAGLERQAINTDLIDSTGKLGDELRKQAALLRERAELAEQGVVVKEAQAAATEWQKVSESIGQGLTDSLYRAFESGDDLFKAFGDGIKNWFKTTVLKLAMQPVQQGITNLVGGLMGGQGGGLSAAGGAGGAGDLLSIGKSLYGAAEGYGSTVAGWMGYGGSGAAAGAAGGGAGAVSGMDLAADAAAGTGNNIAAAGQGMSGSAGFNWTGWAALIYAGVVKAQSDYEEGFDSASAADAQNRMFGEGAKYGDYGLEATIAKSFEAIGFNEKWTSLLSGQTAVAKLIGLGAPQVEGRNIVGNIGGEGFDGNLDQRVRQKGGLLRGDKVSIISEALGGEIDATIDTMAKALREQAKAYGDALGLPVEQLKDVVKAIDIDVTFAEGDEVAKRVSEAVRGYSAALFGSFDVYVKQFQRVGESVEQTLGRLVGLQKFSEGLNQFGGVFSSIANLSIGAKEELLSFAGGIEAFTAKVQGFVGTYYSEEEQVGIQARSVADQLTALGFDPAAFDELSDFRALIEAQSETIGTTDGRKQFDALLTLSQSFASVGQYLEELRATEGGEDLDLAAIAERAPQTQILQAMLADQADVGQQTVDQLYGIDSSVKTIGDRIVGALESLELSIETGQARMIEKSNDQLRIWRGLEGPEGLRVEVAT